ncbi:MAG: EF-hand domain-containing protein [Brevundimonas sp.]|jgi:Ca2+-binding EF-hand superfamily protein|uniref:EF-hand domain-containing protein n=1 Tax=Brevundimonas sp. TaxID=1871086 RepID=UPI00391C19FB
MKKTLITTAALSLALAGSAFAQDNQRRAAPERVSQAEFVERAVSRLVAADTNRDGMVSQAEMQAQREQMRTQRQARSAERRAQMFDRLDANNDGVVSREEFEAARQRGERARGAGEMRRGAAMMRRGGARMQGQAGEMRRGWPEGGVSIAEARQRAAERFAAMDANGDGYVTQDERRAYMQARQGERRERMAQRRQQASD